MNCTKCGAELSPGAKFCEKCGNSIPEQTFTCQKCLNPLKKNQKFCGECGSEIDPTIYLPKNNVCKGKTKDGNLCGATVNTDVKFCSKCGHCQHAEEPAAKPEEQAASSIGEHTTGIQEANPDRKSGDKDLQQQSSSDLEKTSKSKKKKKKKKKGKEKVKPEDETNHGNGKEKAESTLEGTTTSNGRDDRKEKEKENAQPRENSHSDSHDDQYMQKKNENPSSEEKLLGDDNDNQQENDKPSSEQKLLDDDKANKQVKENAKPRENTRSGSHNDQHTQKENKGSNAEENILDDDNDNGNQQEKENSKPRENTRSDSHDDQYMQKENKKPNSEKKLLDDDNDNGNQQENKRPNSEEKLLDDNNDNSNQEEKENVKPMENSRSDCHDDQYMQKENKRPNSEEKLLDDDNGNSNQEGKEESTPIEKARSEDQNDLKTQVITSTIPEIGHQSSGSRNGSGAKRKHKGMEVIFYAALVEQFIDNKSAETVCLQFDFGRAKMRYIGSSTIDDEVFHKYKASVVFSEPTSNHKVYNYNYFVTRTNGEEVMEYVHNNGTNFKCRTIQFRNSSTNAIQHRHDGIVRGKQVYSKGMFTKAFSGVVNYFTGNEKNDQKLLRKDAENAIKIYTSLLRIDSIGPEDIDKPYREIIDNVLLNLRRRYYIEEYLWSQTEDFEKFAGKVMRPHIQQCLRDLIMKRNQDIDVQLQVLCMKTSITVLCLVLSYKVELSAEDKFMLCSSLLPYLGKDTSKCEDMEAVKMSVNTTRKLAEYIIALMRSVIKDSKSHPCWMFCVPLLHFLQDKYVPYQEVPVLSNHKDGNPTWWGIESFITEIQTFKKKNPWEKVLLNDFSRKLAPYFQLDYFLPRTLIATFYVADLNNVEELGVPEDAVLASLYYHIALARYMSTQFAVESRGIATKVSTSLCSLTKNKRYSIKDAERLNSIAEDLISVCLKKKNDLFLKHKYAIISIAEVYFASVHWLNNGLSLEGQDDNEPLKYYQRIAAFEEHVNLFCKFVNPTLKHRGAADLEKWLEEWSTPFEMKIPDGDVKNHIDLQLKKIQEEELQKMKYHPNDIIMIYCNSAESFPSQTQELLSRYAFKVLDQCKNLESVEGKLQNDNRRQKTFGMLLSNVFERSLDEKKMQDDNNLLFMHALSWAPFATFAKLFYNISYKQYLGETFMKWMKKFLQSLRTVLTSLLDGTITVKNLEVIRSFEEQFISILNEMKDDRCDVSTLIKIRLKELKRFQETMTKVQEFMYVCESSGGNAKDLEDEILRDYNIRPLDSLVKVELLLNIDIENYQPIVQAFSLDSEILNALSNILECKSKYFMQLLWSNGSDLARQKDRQLTAREVYADVWKPSYDFWKSMCSRLRNGQILFSELKEYFDTPNLDALKEIFDQICTKDDENDWVEQRLHQFIKYTNIRSCSIGAKAILKVVKTYDLTGDFSQITDIDKLTKGDDTSMNTIDEKLVQTCSILRGIDEVKAECLNIFAESKDLVVWLREAMPTGQKELKVFVDLASITAGEGDIEIAKVNCLHAATTGFAPLIFSLTSDCNERVFLDKCNEIWKTLSSDCNLGTKLIDTRRQLQWLKSVKKSHGSVEVTSLSQADAINEMGIYKIGNWTKRNINENMTITDVLELILPETESSPVRRYSFQKLNDLQSRLMLVAGKADKGKESVDRFMLIFDSVVRLGQIYIKLLTDGCVLFSKWYVNLLCDKTRPACVHIHFGEGKNTVTLKGKVDSRNEDVIAIIPRVAKFLEQCHDKWMEYISEKRDKFYLLNYFTIDQMVILQRELVKLGSDEEPSLLIYPLLSAVKSNCTEEELMEAMHSAKAEIKEKESAQNCQDDQSENKATEISEDEKTKAFVVRMKKAGYDTELALQALQHVPSADDYQRGVVWCMKNEKEYKEMKRQEELRIQAEKVEEATFKPWTNTTDSISTTTANIIDALELVEENAVGKLIEALEELWDKFLNSISSSVSDYLSMEHLGIILDKLNEKAQTDIAKLNRKFFAAFTEGEPNLIICSQSEILNTVLSVYNQGDTVSLPLSDEVLVCTNTTSFDMLETFWRRSLFSRSHRIYCLVNADLLNYDVSDKGERALERFMQHPSTNDSKYRLVVICSSENEYKSRIVAFLAKYHKQQLPTDVQNIRNYLVKEFASQEEEIEILKACIVDHERCNVRVVKSWRAGVGKTLYKKRMVEKLLQCFPNIERKRSVDISVTLHDKTINTDDVMDVFIEETLAPSHKEPRIVHIDISHEVEVGVDFFLFQLLILGCVQNSSGYVWRKSHLDYYIIESMPLLAKDADFRGGKVKYVHHCLAILPSLCCRGPQESKEVLSNTTKPYEMNTDILFDEMEFQSSTFQRPYHYLKRYSEDLQIDFFNPAVPSTNAADCLQELLKYCGIKDPSWSELYHFVSFLDKQLENFEGSVFCSSAAMGVDFKGFPKFVLRFLILMSRDFSTRSLKVSEESPSTLLNIKDTEGTGDDNVIEQYGMRRTWETSPHPYLFFNPDGHTMTFLGFDVNRKSGDLRDQQSGKILEKSIITTKLFYILVKNGVNLNENFDKLSRVDKLKKLRQVMGSTSNIDPDPTYELTTDNVKKILAVYMRFRCDIPVIIMGETGCGKTRLIRFMCLLQLPSRQLDESHGKCKNMILMKVHGGTKASDIIRKVQQAETIASENAELFPNIFTVLFFDEANTTEAIGIIKEIMCDKSLSGKPIKLHKRLKIIAACNPYRKHSEELIKKLEQAGLGYHVDAENTTDKLGRVPMRRLVYRVQPLPQSMLPLVWDFGQLSTDVEEMYTRQMILRYINSRDLPNVPGIDTVLSKILTVSQNFMRDQRDECSFVSLRDVERVLAVMSWFISQLGDNSILSHAMNTIVGETEHVVLCF